MSPPAARARGLDRRASISLVVPVFNAEATLTELVTRASAVLPSIADRYEIVLVNDGSVDRSWSIVEALADRFAFVVGINLMRNYGQHNALLCGVRAATGELVATIDDDLQNPPEELPALVTKLGEGYDVVYGTPQHPRHGFLRGMASWITKLALSSVMGAETARYVSPFRVFRAQVRDAFAGFRSPFISIDILLTWGTTRFAAVPVRHEARAEGASNYTWGKLVTHAVNMVTGFSTMPLQFASLMGFSFTLVGFGVLAFVVGRYFIQGSTVPGFPFLASIMAIFFGVEFFALGVIGEYLARMHFRTLEQPPYVIRERAAGAQLAAADSVRPV